MDIRIYFALLVGIYLDVAYAEEQPIPKDIIDLSHICDGREDGKLVPHPFDCNAYFTCGAVPTVTYCDQGLHFDMVKLLCDVPLKAHCNSTEAATNSTSNIVEVNSNPDISWLAQKPQPIFVAVDVVTGEPVNPMDKYDPRLIECRHFGAYFLPHPTNCQLYYICAYGYLHHHRCGAGTFWNYRSSECQLIKNAECYSTASNVQATPETPEETSTAAAGQITVCYIVNSSGSSTLPIDQEQTTLVTVSPPQSGPQSALTCPSHRQSYLPHPDDCSRYYICIVGMPVLTSCPTGLYWDQKAGYCDQAKNVKCFQNELIK